MAGLTIPLPPEQLDFDLPAIPQLSLELMQILHDEDAKIHNITDIIGLDPVLSGRILAYANSPFQGALQPVGSLETAVIRMGRQELRTIFYRTILRDAFARTDPEHQHILQAIWTQSLAASLAVHKIHGLLRDSLLLSAEEERFLSPLSMLSNTGFLVLHHNFRPAFTAFFLENPPLSLDTFLSDQHAVFEGLDHCLAGKYLLDRWYFPAFMGNALDRSFAPQTPTPDNAVPVLLRLANHLVAQTGLSFFPPCPENFWIAGLPESFDLQPLHDLLPAILHELGILQGILDMDT